MGQLELERKKRQMGKRVLLHTVGVDTISQLNESDDAVDNSIEIAEWGG